MQPTSYTSYTYIVRTQCKLEPVFIAGIVLGGKDSPPKKNGCQNVCSEFFFGRNNELPIYHGNFLLMDRKLRKLFAIKQSKGCKFTPKVHQNAFGGRALSEPAGGACALP